MAFVHACLFRASLGTLIGNTYSMSSKNHVLAKKKKKKQNKTKHLFRESMWFQFNFCRCATRFSRWKFLTLRGKFNARMLKIMYVYSGDSFVTTKRRQEDLFHSAQIPCDTD